MMPDVVDGKIEPGRVFDRTVGLDQVPDGYRAMADREAPSRCSSSRDRAASAGTASRARGAGHHNEPRAPGGWLWVLTHAAGTARIRGIT
jgi:hypothetical protein